MGGRSGGGITRLFTTGLIDNGINEGLLTPSKPIPPLLPPEPVAAKPEIPTQNMDEIKAAKAARALSLSRRSGRASTVLTDQPGNKLGG